MHPTPQTRKPQSQGFLVGEVAPGLIGFRVYLVLIKGIQMVNGKKGITQEPSGVVIPLAPCRNRNLKPVVIPTKPS